jgi:hypothetical protein
MSTTYTHSELATSRTTGIATQTLNTVSRFAGAEIDNSVNLEDLLDIEMLFTLAATPVAGDQIKIFILYALGGTTYEDGVPTTNDGAHDDGNAAFASAQVACVGVQAIATAQRVTFKDIPLTKGKFKIMVYNGTTKSCTSLLTVLAWGKKRQTIG